MAEEEGAGGPSLEPPRLWRKKKPADETASAEAVPHAPVEPEPVVLDGPVAASVTAPVTAVPVAAPLPEPAAAPAPAPTRVDTPWIPAGKSAKPGRSQVAKAPKRTREPRAPRTPRAPRAAHAPRPARPARPPRQRIEIPPLNPHLAAAVTGLLVGGWLVLSTFTTLRMCESVRGASACGGPGMLLLVVIVVGGIALGATVLRSFKIRSAGSMSFLAVALVAVLVMVFFAGSPDQWWTIPVVALLTVGSYSLSHWITTTYIDPED